MPPAPTAEAVSLLAIPEAARRLDCSGKHVYRLIEAGVLRAVDIGTPGSGRSKTRVRSDDLAAYIKSHTRTVRTGGAAEEHA